MSILNLNFSLTEALGLLIIYQCLFFLVQLFFKRKTKTLFIRALVSICLLMIIHFSYMLYENMLHEQYFLGPFFGLLYGPISYMFFKSLAYKEIDLRKEWLNFIPSILFLIASLFVKEVIEYMFYISVFVTAHFFVYLFITLKSIFDYRRKLKMSMSNFDDKNLKWLEVIIYIQLVIITTTILESYYAENNSSEIFIALIYVLVLALIYCFYYLGLKHVAAFSGIEPIQNLQKKKSEYLISDKLFEDCLVKLNHHISTKRPYLEFDLSLQNLSDELEISQRNLSHIINSAFGKNFYDYINSFRLEVAKEDLIHTSKAIKEIMYDSGFSNKATFNTVFKKATQMTPTEFRATYKK